MSSMKRALALALLASCRQERPLDEEIRIVRSDIASLESELPPEAGLWMPEFAQQLEDDTPSVPDAVYRHVVRKLHPMTDAEISRQAQTAPVKELKDHPGAHRGHFVKIFGMISKLWVEDVAIAGFPRQQVYAGILFAGNEPVLFHTLTPPQLLYMKEDMIGFEGLFLKIVHHDLANGGTLRAPFLVARTVHKYH